jgi:hypothetical protein
MAAYFQYLLEATICLSVFYLAYLLILKKEGGFAFLRMYLLCSIIVSLLLPLNSYQIKFLKNEQAFRTNYNAKQIVPSQEVFSGKPFKPDSDISPKTASTVNTVDYFKWIYIIYIAIAVVLVLKFIIGILTIVWYSIRMQNEKFNNLHVIWNDRFSCSFSFFSIIFIHKKDLSKKEIIGIIAHENIHVAQYHTIDLILVELLSAVMWFNPLVWLLRNSLRQVHEYLADEGVLNIGFDRLEYQALLINQVAESRLFSLASTFNQSQIKNRLIMMTKQNSGNRTKLKILALLPMAVILFFAISCFNGTKDKNLVTAIAPTKMNVLYIGLENPVTIAASGYESSELTVKIDNGTVEGKDGMYIVKPSQPRLANLVVSANGKEIQKSVFRVKFVPDPVTKVAGIKGVGAIKKDLLLKQEGVVAEIENFDFDLRFKIVEFTVSTVVNGYATDRVIKGNKFSEQQLELIKKVEPGAKVYIEGIKTVGPDGMIRQLVPIVLIIK